eukprot:gene25736-31479_t
MPDEQAKILIPYLQRADEIANHDPLIAYYCRMHAVEEGVKITDRTDETTQLLVAVMKQLEADKEKVNPKPEDKTHCEDFAVKIFDRADAQDRAGKATANTAKAFYASTIFMEVLQQFGEVNPEVEARQKYAAWKSADIRKALREGRTPTPGPPGGDEANDD